MTWWAGIDPGRSGAVAVTNGEGSDTHPLQLEDDGELDAQWLEGWLERFSPRLVTLEQVQGFGGVSSAFKLGASYGAIIVTVLSARYRLERVRPQAWQKKLLGDDIKDTKAASVAWCNEHMNRTFRKRDHNEADALCLAEYGRRVYGCA